MNLETLDLDKRFILSDSDSIANGNDTNEEAYKNAIDMLKSMSQQSDLFKKIDCLVLVRHTLHLCISNYYTLHPERKQKRDTALLVFFFFYCYLHFYSFLII